MTLVTSAANRVGTFPVVTHRLLCFLTASFRYCIGRFACTGVQEHRADKQSPYIYISTPLHLHISSQLHIYTSPPLHMFMSTHLHAYITTCLHICASTHSHIYISSHVHIWIHTYTSTYLQILIHTDHYFYTSTCPSIHTRAKHHTLPIHMPNHPHIHIRTLPPAIPASSAGANKLSNSSSKVVEPSPR